MTRTTAKKQDHDLPGEVEWPPHDGALAAAIIALSHPGRRRLLDELTLAGSATVGHLARVAGMSAGSASYHLHVLAKAGFITPAPELTDDTRESWWRSVDHPVTCSMLSGSAASEPDTAAEQLTELATRANLDDHPIPMEQGHQTPEAGDWSGIIADATVSATVDQCRELKRRLNTVVAQWATECRTDHSQPRQAPRRTVRAVATLTTTAAGTCPANDTTPT